MNVTNIARCLVRKIAKPVALWLTDRALRASAAEAHRLMTMRTDLVGLELNERKREVVLAARLKQIRNW
jgi:hypothetical protein